MTKKKAEILRANRYTTNVWEASDGTWMVQFTLSNGGTTVVINTASYELAPILLRKNLEIIKP